MRRLLVVAAVVLGALCAGPAAAVAHPLLDTAAPAPGVVSPHAPAQITLAFSEGAVARGSALTVRDRHGKVLRVGRLRSASGGRQLSAPLPSRLPAGVYRVHWVALGTDGHTTSGDFSFGVAGPHGAPPPGVETLGGGLSGSRGGSAAAEGAASVVARWLGLAAGAVLFGGLLLVLVLRRRGVPGADVAGERLGAVLPIAWLVALLAASESIFAEASAGASRGLNFGLLTASGTGIAAIVRMAVLATLSLVLGRFGLRRPRLRRALYGAGGLTLLLSYALSGHVLAQGSTWPVLVMAIHVLAAGVWAGGLIALVLVTRGGEVASSAAARAFAWVGATALGAAAVTGAVSAIREVHGWYFLRWSDYGRVVLIKTAVVVLATIGGAVTAWRARTGRGEVRLGVVRIESGLLVTTLLLAALLAGLAQGRGRPLPAENGNLLPGPAIASALLPGGTAGTTLAPARAGQNVFAVLPPRRASSLSVRLACACHSGSVNAVLHRGEGGAWSAPVDIPEDGDWYAYLRVDGKPAPSPVQLTVGVAPAPGAPVRDVLSVADLSGPGAARCRAHLLGLELALGRLNASGGVQGGRKVALRALDDGGSPGRAGQVARSALGGQRPLALVPCGSGAEGAVAAAGRAGVPSLIGDPAVDPVPAPRAFRLAADPYADGVALGQAVAKQVLPSAQAGVRVVRAIVPDDDQGERRLQGLRAELARTHARLVVLAPKALIGASPARLAWLLDRRRTAALVLDGTDADVPGETAALHRLGRLPHSAGSAVTLASERVLSERLIEGSGTEGRVGAVQGTSAVQVDSRDALALVRAIPALYPGEHPSLDALRGYVTGLALLDGLGGGTSPSSIANRLARPSPFTDALGAPWRSDMPAAGSPRVGLLAPTFLPATLIPTSQGGEAYAGNYFGDGAWTRVTSELYGPSLEEEPPPLSAGPNGSNRG